MSVWFFSSGRVLLRCFRVSPPEFWIPDVRNRKWALTCLKLLSTSHLRLHPDLKNGDFYLLTKLRVRRTIHGYIPHPQSHPMPHSRSSPFDVFVRWREHSYVFIFAVSLPFCFFHPVFLQIFAGAHSPRTLPFDPFQVSEKEARAISELWAMRANFAVRSLPPASRHVPVHLFAFLGLFYRF